MIVVTTPSGQLGSATRALSMPFFMENLFRQLGPIREHGAFSLPYAADRPLATVATRDVAAIAASLLADRSWGGQEHVPVFGPDSLTPNEMAVVLADVLERNVTYRQQSLADVASALRQRGAGDGVVRDVAEAVAALDEGIYDADHARSSPRPTDFRTRCCGPACLPDPVKSGNQRPAGTMGRGMLLQTPLPIHSSFA